MTKKDEEKKVIYHSPFIHYETDVDLHSYQEALAGLHSDYKGYHEERLQETLQEYHSKINNSMNCPDIGSEKLEEYAREYMDIEKKLSEIPEDKETIRRVLELRKQQLIEKVSELSGGRDDD